MDGFGLTLTEDLEGVLNPEAGADLDFSGGLNPLALVASDFFACMAAKYSLTLFATLVSVIAFPATILLKDFLSDLKGGLKTGLFFLKEGINISNIIITFIIYRNITGANYLR